MNSARCLVYTCAGDHSEVSRWVRGSSTSFDLMVVYYGDAEFQERHLVTHYFERKGSKFQNLAFFAENYPEIFRSYDAIFVVDDDIVISGRKIAELFDLVFCKDLTLLQPAFLRDGKISHKITEAQPWSMLRYSNFVEVTCPLFKTLALLEFLKTYDSRLVGWGVDYLFSRYVNENYGVSSTAIIDSIPCRNPFDQFKATSGRVIDVLQPKVVRQNVWEALKREKHLDQNIEKIEQFESKSEYSMRGTGAMVRIYYARLWYYCARKIQSLLKL